jgi:hypothetical protein
VLYTDGLTEATRDVLEGERRLRDALTRDDILSFSEARGGDPPRRRGGVERRRCDPHGAGRR